MLSIFISIENCWTSTLLILLLKIANFHRKKIYDIKRYSHDFSYIRDISRHQIFIKDNYLIIPIINITVSKHTLHNQISTKTKHFIVFCDMSLPNNLIKLFSMIKEITYYPTTLHYSFSTHSIFMDQYYIL